MGKLRGVKVAEPETGDSQHAPPGRRLREEIIDHLIPWGPQFLARRAGFRALGIGFAVVVTVAWLLAAAGRLRATAVIAWWVGWSVYEVLCRRRCKPWVWEGFWGTRKRRPADLPDVVFYVATKNLLIGAGLFLAVKLFEALAEHGYG